ncbi:MAG: hypothetical protein QOJ57_1656, partial [Thermoleophilaceae bacterium]|nr:hypothetical protein [Thermoleophilaceae bacterium]
MGGASLSRSRVATNATLGAFALVALVALGWTAETGKPLPLLVPAVAVAIFAATYRVALQWRVLVGTLIVVILFIPIRRYTLPSGLPFELEPYRLLVAVLTLCWLGALLAEPEKVRFPKSPINAPIVLILGAILGSIAVNAHLIGDSGISDVVAKKVTFFLSFVAVAYLVGSVIRTREQVIAAVKVLVVGGSIVAAFAILESRTGHNQFNDLQHYIPFLKIQGQEVLVGGALVERTTRARAYVTAQHPIALGAAMVVLLPLALYLVRATGRRFWFAAAALLFTGAIGSISRTPFLMLVAVGIVIIWFKPREARRAAPLVLVMLVVVHAAIPGALGGIKNAFMPTGGLVAEQKKNAGGAGSGRVADLGPALEEWSRYPLLGEGFGTRITPPDTRANAMILDNQWLASLIEGGAIGVFAFGWLFVRAVRRLRRVARKDGDGEMGWLATSLAASITA